MLIHEWVYNKCSGIRVYTFKLRNCAINHPILYRLVVCAPSTVALYINPAYIAVNFSWNTLHVNRWLKFFLYTYVHALHIMVMQNNMRQETTLYMVKIEIDMTNDMIVITLSCSCCGKHYIYITYKQWEYSYFLKSEYSYFLR